MVGCACLSGGFVTSEIDPATYVVLPEHDAWKHRSLDLLAAGRTTEASDLAAEDARATGADWRVKAYLWRLGAAGSPTVPARGLASGPIRGSGTAVVAWALG